MKLSIVIPVFNTSKLLLSAVQSILEQPFQDWELILVDDGSTDDSFDICTDLAKQDRRIKAFHTDNQGAYKARLTGVEKAKGEWVMFMDSDDSITRQCITGLFNYSEQNHDIIIGTININNRKTFSHKISGKIDSETYIEAILLSNTSIGPYAKIYKRSLFTNIPIPQKRITINEDMLLLISLAKNAKSIYIDPELICYNYIFRDNSISRTIMSLDKWQLLFNFIDYILPKHHGTRFDIALNKLIINRCYFLICRGIYLTDDLEFVKKALRTDPKELNRHEKRTLRLLSSPKRQHFKHKIFIITSSIKTFLKRFI